jgi:signal transduction histidine kinase
VKEIQLDTISLLIAIISTSFILTPGMLVFWSSRNRFLPALDMALGNLGLTLLTLHMLYIELFSKSILFATLVPVTTLVFFSYRAIRGVYGAETKQIPDLIVLGTTILISLIFTLIPHYSYRQVMYGIFVGFFCTKALLMIFRQTESDRTSGDVFVFVYLLSYAFIFIYRGIFFLFNYVEVKTFTSEKLSPLYILFILMLLLFGNAGFLIVATVKADRARNKAMEEALDQKTFAEHLVSIISNNLNSNLATINQAVDLLKQNNNETQKKIPELEIIGRTTRQTRNIITDLVYWGRSRCRNPEQTDSTILISELLQQVTEDLSQLIKVKEILLIRPEKYLNISVKADAMAARVVLRNILSNILMITSRKGCVKIEITAEEKDIALTVSNQGTKLTLPGLNTEKENGTGWLIVRTICTAHNWPLLIRSDSEQIKLITIRFPRSQL